MELGPNYGCSVYSPCGRYHVTFSATPTALTFVVRPKEHARTPVAWTATVDEAAVDKLSATAGLSKTLTTFAHMAYSAMTGAAGATVRFFIETVAEMTERVQSHPEGPSLDAEKGGEEGEDDGVLFVTVHLSSEFAAAMFPIPLAAVTDADAIDGDAPPARAVRPPPRTPPTAPRATIRGASASPMAGDAGKSAERSLREEVERLQRENASLRRFSEKEMSRMLATCEELKRRRATPPPSHSAEVRALREEAAGLRREVERLREELRRAKDSARRGTSPHRPSPSPRAPPKEKGNRFLDANRQRSSATGMAAARKKSYRSPSVERPLSEGRSAGSSPASSKLSPSRSSVGSSGGWRPSYHRQHVTIGDASRRLWR